MGVSPCRGTGPGLPLEPPLAGVLPAPAQRASGDGFPGAGGVRTADVSVRGGVGGRSQAGGATSAMRRTISSMPSHAPSRAPSSLASSSPASRARTAGPSTVTATSSTSRSSRSPTSARPTATAGPSGARTANLSRTSQERASTVSPVSRTRRAKPPTNAHGASPFPRQASRSWPAHWTDTTTRAHQATRSSETR